MHVFQVQKIMFSTNSFNNPLSGENFKYYESYFSKIHPGQMLELESDL